VLLHSQVGPPGDIISQGLPEAAEPLGHRLTGRALTAVTESE
jgi:hypothetical protein